MQLTVQKSKQFRLAAAGITLALGLSACGGGGTGGSNSINQPASVAADQSPAAADTGLTIASVVNPTLYIPKSTGIDLAPVSSGIANCATPTPLINFSEDTGFAFVRDAEENQFLVLINHLRCVAYGEKTNFQVTRNSALDVAADNHAAYSVSNDSVTHTQTVGLGSFTGTSPGKRIGVTDYPKATGKDEPVAWGEVLSKTGSMSQEAFDGLSAAIYHRFVMLSSQINEVGIALRPSKQTGSIISVVDFASKTPIRADRVIVFPANGQANVAPAFNSDYETPDPFPNASFVGYPVSIQSDRGTKLTVARFELYKVVNGQRVDTETPTWIRGTGAKAVSDNNLESHEAFLVGQESLEHDTQYEAIFVGTYVEGASGPTVVTKIWRFTTAAKGVLAVAETTTPALNKYSRVQLKGCGTNFKWQYTSGLEVSIFSGSWMQVKGIVKGAQWLEVTDACGVKQRIDYVVQ